MTKEQNAIIQLVRRAVNPDAPVSFEQSIDWTEALVVAKKQGVLGVCLESVKATHSQLNMPIEVLMKWLGIANKSSIVYTKHKEILADLAHFYDREGVRLMLLKGYGLSHYWPVPEYRPVGDIDSFNFGLHQFADECMREKLGVDIDNSHHKHSIFNYKGVTVENHFSFLNTHGHKSTAEIEKILHSVLNEVKDKEIDNLYYPSVKFNSLYLLRHSGEHFASVNMTLRHVLDWGFFVKGNEVDWEWLQKTLDRVGMKRYLAVLNAICVRYMGFDEGIFPQLTISDAIIERSINDILQPEVEKEHHEIIFAEVVFRFKRWWKNGWKHDIVYRESRWQSLMTQMWSHILKPTL